MKETLIIYRDWWEAIKSLPTNLRFEAFDAICSYAFEGKQPEDPIIAGVTALMRSTVDRDKAKYEEICNKRSQAIKSRWEKLNKIQENTNEYKCINSIQTNTSTTDNEHDNDNDYEYDNDNKSSKEDNILKNNNKDIELEKEFEAFRVLYPGTKRGLNIELGNLKKKYPKEWRQIIPKLRPAVEKLIAYHKEAEEAKSKGAQIFIPNYAYLQTWINQARWEETFPEIPEQHNNGSHSQIIETDYSDTDFGGMKY